MKDIKGLAKKWPEMVTKWFIVTTRLGESVFKSVIHRGPDSMVSASVSEGSLDEIENLSFKIQFLYKFKETPCSDHLPSTHIIT